MGIWDLTISIVLAAIPLLFIGIAVSDWRRFKRKRYLVMAGAYLLFGFGLLGSFLDPQDSMTNCFSSFAAIVVLGLIHSSVRRGDISKPAQAPQGQTKV